MEVRFFSLIKCPPRANFDRSHDGSASIFNFGPLMGPFWHTLVPEKLHRPLGDLADPSGCLNGLRLTKYDPLLCILPVRCFRIHGTPKGAFQKCSFGPKRAFWGPQRSLEGLRVPDLVPTAADWSNRIGHMVTTHWYWASSGPKGTPKGPVLALSAPFWPN